MYAIGLDLGTTGVKALTVDETGQPAGMAYREVTLVRPKAGWCEHDPAEVLRLVEEVLAQAAVAVEGQVEAIALSSHAQAVLPIDRASNPLYNIIVTMDDRTVPQFHWWQQNADEEEIFLRTGVPFGSIYTVNKLMWHRQNNPQIFEKAWKFCCVQDYVSHWLTGEGPFIDYSLAGRTMMFDPRAKDWESRVLELSGIPKEKLSKPMPSSTVVGTLRDSLASRLGLKKGIPVVLGAHDQVCGMLGAGVTRPGMAMDSCGTVEAMLVALPQLAMTPELLRCKYPCYPHAVPGQYVSMALNLNSGLLLKWFKDTFCQQETAFCAERGLDVYTYLIEHSAPDPSNILILPHLQGAGTPLMDPESQAAIVGLRAGHTKQDVCRAILDSLAYDMKQNIEAVEQAVGPIREIRMVGGGARTPRWLQIKANVFQKKLVTMKVREGAAMGAAILAMVQAGAYEDCCQAADHMVQVQQEFLPEPDQWERYRLRYEQYGQLYHSLRQVNHSLSQLNAGV